ncbi:hypothetical protein [Natronorubrum thiooxidans]|uniref:Uncharacterized protein n=1 Tax=Natronorubrum thiooxidans TaxID=308853 RepID=A0A1N7GKZ0_9EURY|nr:hypothetical protein [Natronorubrum thiooxidans]SIS13199.1 hypothetical protein SAMN05421752_11310 [Natronorubrum thiooxidans]
MIHRRLLRQGPSDPPGFSPKNVPDDPTNQYLSYDESTFHCRTVTSPDNDWTLAFGRRADGEESRTFRFQSEELIETRPASQPVDGAIANDGTAVVVSGSDSNTVGGELNVLGDDTVALSHRFETTLGKPAIQSDGDWCAVVTRPPEPTAHLFYLRSRTHREHSFQERGVHMLGVHDDECEEYLYLGVRSTTEPFLALDDSGEIVWESDRSRAMRPFTDRISSFVNSLRP